MDEFPVKWMHREWWRLGQGCSMPYKESCVEGLVPKVVWRGMVGEPSWELPRSLLVGLKVDCGICTL